MMAVRNRHGIGIIQNPDEAIAAEMPRNALKYAGADYILSAKEIGPKLTELIKSREAAMKKHDRKSKAGKKSRDPEPWQNETVSSNGQGTGKPSVFACPECHGVLWEIKDGKMTRFRCRVGHAYGATSLKSEIDQSTERALWAALRSLEEKASMRERLVDTNRGSDRLVRRFRDQISADRANADLIRKMILAN
jgi:two-component system chemotaxis response regulator CheB